MSDSLSHIAVLGAGAWGTALALAAHGAGRQVSLWVREDDVLADIRAGEGQYKYFYDEKDAAPLLAAMDRAKKAVTQ